MIPYDVMAKDCHDAWVCTSFKEPPVVDVNTDKDNKTYTDKTKMIGAAIIAVGLIALFVYLF